MWEWLESTGSWWASLGYYAKSVASWAILATSAFGGVVGVIVPVIPGAIVLLAGTLLFKWLNPGWLSWWTIGGLAFLTIMDRVADFAGTAAGSRWFGGTRWGILGALIGGVVGLFFGILGIVFGPVIGAVVFELVWAKRHPREAARSGFGAGVGFGLSMAGRFAICLAMLVVIGVDLMTDRY